jgi:RNA polymerase sigma-70 factor (ECF subfamily)
MFAVCLRYSKSHSEAQDIMQDAFIKVFENINGFRQEGSFEGWIRRIMVNTALNYIQKSAKDKFLKDIDSVNETEIDDGEIAKRPVNFSSEELLSLVQKLPPGYKTVFNLYVFEKFKHKEIAEILNISENTSKSQLSKARVYLQKGLKKLGRK